MGERPERGGRRGYRRAVALRPPVYHRLHALDAPSGLRTSRRGVRAGLDKRAHRITVGERVGAASAEESSSAAAEVSAQTQELSAAVGSFKLEPTQARPGPTAHGTLVRPAGRGRRLERRSG